MRRADRLFDIIQALRGKSRPVTAATLAKRLEVTVRTIYRDIAALQARRIPIEGEPGIGYVLRKGYDLPPLMFTTEELESIAVGAGLVRRVRDPQLQEAAESVLSKLQVAVPDALRDFLSSPRIHVAEGKARPPNGIDLSELRGAIRGFRKMRISYMDEEGRRTRRTIRPIAMVYYIEATLIAAWCEKREDYRHFRVDRIQTSKLLDDTFGSDHKRHMIEWRALQKL